MIVVVGRPVAQAVRAVAGAVAARGVRCEVVGAVAPDPGGDRLLQDLARAGVGHAAVLRSVASDLEPADLELALRYLPDIRVIILVEQDGLVGVVDAAAQWSGASLIRITARTPDTAVTAGERTVVLAAPPRDPDGAFAGLVGALAARLEVGEPLADAWAATLATVGAEAVGGAPVSARVAGPRAAPAARAPRAAARSARQGPDRHSGRR